MCMHTHLKEMLRDECSTFLNVLVINFQNQLNNNHGVLVDRSNLDGFIIYWIFIICSEVVNIGDGGVTGDILELVFYLWPLYVLPSLPSVSQK